MFLKKIKEFLFIIIPRPGFLAWCLFSVHLVYLALFIRGNIAGYGFSACNIVSMVFSFFTLLLVATALEFLFIHRITASIVIIMAVLTAWALNAYHLTSGSSLDYSLVRDNLGISFSPESFSMISTVFSIIDIILLPVIAFLLYAVAKMLPGGKPSLKRNSIAGRLTAIVLWLLAVITPVNAGDEFTVFIKSALAYNDAPRLSGEAHSGYPYFSRKISRSSFRRTFRVPSENKPNVFLILIESYNANFVEAQAPDGLPYTPCFNSLINKGVYIERFYGNSIQTCKGQAAVFFSIIPPYKGKLFVDYPGLEISGFPALLANAGYETVFFQAYHDLEFDNTYNSMVKAGFGVVKSFKEFRRPGDRPHIWGWGVEDKVFYERFFYMLDGMHKNGQDKPLFAALMTVGTHIPCDGIPPEKMSIYKNPRNIKEKYSNALRLSDSQLPRFFELLGERDYLKNSIVIITADHSFPMKEHGIYNNEKCFYDEAFRVPFLVMWDGVIKPERIKEKAYSQIDIGPTIMDMLGIYNAENNMTGISVFNGRKSNPVFLVQPYNGRYLQVVDYPFKYIFHVQSGREYLFNLKEDPMEQKNIATTETVKGRPESMKRILNRIHINQQLIDENRIRPVKVP